MTLYLRCLTILLPLVWWKAGAQPQCTVEHYATKDGLSHSTVTCMLKDHEGFMWFGGWNGINRFDGHRFVSYKSLPGDRSQLTNSRIEQMVEDQSNQLWLRAYDKHIYRFDKATEQFGALETSLTEPGQSGASFKQILGAFDGLVWLESSSNGIYCVSQQPGKKVIQVYNTRQPGTRRLPSDTIHFFLREDKQQIWIGTAAGLCCLVRGKSGDYNIRRLPADLAPGKTPTTTAEDNESLYFGTADGWLITYRKAGGTFTQQRIATSGLRALYRSKKKQLLYASTKAGELVTLSLNDLHTTTARFQGSGLRSLYEDRQGYLWIEPEQHGVIRFDPATQTFQTFSDGAGNRKMFTGSQFLVEEDNNGVIWIKMKGGSFGYYHAASASIQYKVDVPELPDYQFPLLVYTCYNNGDGVIWLTTEHPGVERVILHDNHFRQQLPAPQPQLKTENEVRGMYADRGGRLWLGTKSGRLYMYHNRKLTRNPFVPELPGGFVGAAYSFLEDTRGNIWIGTKGNGLYKAMPASKEPQAYKLQHLAQDKMTTSGLPAREIYSLLEDNQQRIWVGSFDKGLWLVQQAGDSICFSPAGKLFAGYPVNGFNKIRHMTTDSAGNLWIGTTDGLLLVEAAAALSKKARCTTYSKIPGDLRSLGNNDLQYVYRDKQNHMWLASSGGGFIHAMGTNPFESLHFRNYTVKDGLANDYVLSCTMDVQGHLWISTENGLSRFHPGKETFRNYDAYDGLPEGVFAEASCRQMPDGEIVFGTSAGLLSFNPRQVETRRNAAAIAFTGLQINNKEAGPSGLALPGNINYLSSLELPYNQNIISIEYALLDQRVGNKQVFAYRLKGFDTAWYEERLLRRATYTRLPPGNYTFEVKCLDNDRFTQIPYRQLRITILPPFWKTSWAYLAYMLVILAVLYFTRKAVLEMLYLRNKIVVEQKLTALKMNFFTNVSHELRTPLTLILGPLEQLMRTTALSGENKYLVAGVRRNAGRMVRFINQLLDLRKLQSGKGTLQLARVEIIGLVRQTCDYFVQAARYKQVRIVIETTEDPLLAGVDPDKLDVVLYNILGNALKFSPEQTEITVAIRTLPAEQCFLVQVSDQGPGVPEDKLEKIFELFYESTPQDNEGKGTGIGLALAKEIVELHAGKIQAVNVPGGGFMVQLQLPIGDTASLPPHTATSDVITAGSIAFNPTASGIVAPPDAPLLLLVEDNAELRNFLQKQLGEHYRVTIARDGAEGWQKAIDLMPDLIVSDIMMPVMDGIQLVDKIKNNFETSHIPVVLLTAKYSVESQVEGLQYGADYYITKPFRNEFLLAAIDNLLRQRRRLFESLAHRKKPEPEQPAPALITSGDELFLQEIICMVNATMANPEFNIEAMAETMHMSRTSFYRKFKSLTGIAPIEFVKNRRLELARNYLSEGQRSVTDIAYQAGFSNPKYFSTCFREKYGVTPSEYRKTVQGRQETG